MSKLSFKPFRPVYPSPAALITSMDDKGRANIITIGECFNVSIAEPVIVGIAVRSDRYSYGHIKQTGEFVVNLPTAAIVRKVDAIGCVSGRACDKFERFGLTPLPASVVRPPLIAECPVNAECRVLSEQAVGDHQMFLGEVVAQHIDEDVLRQDGLIDAERLDVLVYACGQYLASAERIGTHGFTRGKP